MNQIAPITLREAVKSAATQWKSNGPSAIERLRAELILPGGKAIIVRRFIDGKFVTRGFNCDVATLINQFSADPDIDEAFDAVLSSLEHFGEPGIELANTIRSQNRHGLNNHKV